MLKVPKLISARIVILLPESIIRASDLQNVVNIENDGGSGKPRNHQMQPEIRDEKVVWGPIANMPLCNERGCDVCSILKVQGLDDFPFEARG